MRRLKVQVILFMMAWAFWTLEIHSEPLRFLGPQVSWAKLQEVQDSFPVKLPLDTAREALELAKQKGLLKNTKVEKLKSSGYLDWAIVVRQQLVKQELQVLYKKQKQGAMDKMTAKNLSDELVEIGDTWEVILQSMGRDPRFKCSISLSLKGMVVGSNNQPICSFSNED